MNLSEATRAAVLVAEAAEVGAVIGDNVETVGIIDTTTIITHCLVCYESLVENKSTICMTPCHHNEICATCHLRLRHLHKDLKCPICKQPNEQIIVDYTAQHKRRGGGFDDYNIWGNDLGADFVYMSTVGVFFPRQYHQEYIQPLLSHTCTVVNCGYGTGLLGDDDEETAGSNNANNNNKNNNNNDNNKNDNNSNASSAILKALQTHLRTKHRLALCQLCIDYNRDFISQLPRYTPNQLKQHLSKGDNRSDSAFNGHPLCEFCRPRRFYDVQQLHYHLNKDHYKCHVCEEQGLHNQFFKNYTSLERHFDHQHYLCKDVQCLQARFVVFSNDLDLRHHERHVHGGTSTGSTKISLEFRVRRPGNLMNENGELQQVPSEADFQYNLDGQAFVPEQLPSRGGANVTSGASEGLTLHPLHIQRTAELRQQAAALRREQELASGMLLGDGINGDSILLVAGGGTAFPSLAETAAAAASSSSEQQQNQFRVGWTSGTTTMQRVGIPKKNVGAVTEESFPSLGGGGNGGASGSGNGAASSSQKRAAQAAQRSFAAMQNSANSATVTTTTTTTAAAASTPNWGGAGSAAAVASSSGVAAFPSLGPPSSSSSSSAFLQATSAGSASAARNNNKANLSADNFPSLGPPPASSSTLKTAPGSTGGGKPRLSYSAAEVLARRYQQEQQQQSVEPFIVRNPSSQSAASAAAVSQSKAAPPKINSDFDFPAPPTQIPQFNAATAAASSSTVTIEEIKASMDKPKYKELKRLTADFAQGNLDATPYVDLSAALFDQGYGDANFWKFVPCLLSSCPNQRDAQKAFAYLETLSKLRNGALNAEQHQQQQQAAAATTGPPLVTAATRSTTATATSSSQGGTTGKWASVPARVVTPQPTAQYAVQRGPSVPLSYATRTTVANMPNAGKAKTSKAWAGSNNNNAGPSIVALAKAPPGNAAVAAAAASSSAAPAGSATKFMAKEQKLQKQQQHQQQQQQQNSAVAAGGKKKNKGKQKNELRQLAFG